MTDSHKTALVVTPGALPERVNPFVAMAMQQSPDPATLRELLALQREWEAGEQKKAFTAAFIALKQDLPAVIEHDKRVKYANVDFTHSSLPSVMEHITPKLINHGFAMTWEPGTTDKGKAVVTCKLTHSGGHFETCTLEGPPDTSGSKNPVQGIASTITQLKRHTALALLGIVTQEETAEPPNPDTTINAKRNLQALARLKARNVTKEEAEKVTGKPIDRWTSADLDALSQRYLKSETKGDEA